MRRFPGLLAGLLSLPTLALSASAAQFYVSPTGGPGGNGSFGNPWSLQTALNQPPSVQPGDTIWVRGGTYTGAFVSTLSGTSAAPIVLRGYPKERVILQGNGSEDPVLWAKNGGYTWFWGLEVTNPNKMSLNPIHDALRTYTPGVKWINMIIHDNANGLTVSWAAIDAQVYGCLIYHNGRDDREHGIYPQNDTGGTKYITDNIVFNNAGFGLHAYSSTQAISRFEVEGNIFYGNGGLTDPKHRTRNMLLGGELPSESIIVKKNYTWNPAGVTEGVGLQIGYGNQSNISAVIEDNYFVSYHPLSAKWWASLIVTGNTFFPTQNNGDWYVELMRRPGIQSATYSWNNNTFVSGIGTQGKWALDSTGYYSLANWQSVTGVDKDSSVVQNPQRRPTGTRVFIRPNAYEPGRANIAVYSWDQLNTVEVDLSAILRLDSIYEIRNAADYFGPPVLAGTYKGGSVSLPLTGLSVASPIGYATPAPTGPEFNAFVVLTTGAARQSPLPLTRTARPQPKP